ncbi:MAG: hypothetical protein ACR2QB_11290 [Gammaproteobacteria bacterium]
MFLDSARLSAEEAATVFAQPPIKIDASLVVPDEWMSGVGFTVEKVAISDGFNNTYTVVHELGNRQATSDYHLRQVIREIRALQTLDEQSRAGVFGDAMKGGLMAPVEGAKALATAPVETTKGAAKGMGRWIANVSRGATSKDPYQENAASAAAGWAGTKRAFALELGVDPWTDWDPLQKALSSVARAAFAGGITASLGMEALAGDGTFGAVVGIAGLTGELNGMLADNPAALVTKINSEKLESAGFSKGLVSSFMLNYQYTPMEKSLLVQSVLRMENASGRDLILGYAAAAPDRVLARYRTQQAEMMANYYADVATFDIVKIGEALWLATGKGALVGIQPIDYLAWTEEVANVTALAAGSQEKDREIWLEGSAGPDARQALTANGWTVNDRVALVTGQPLQQVTAEGAGLGVTGTVIKTITQ